MSQRELADIAGIDRTYLVRIETEAVNISVNVLFSLAHALDVPPAELVSPPGDES